MIGAGRRWLDDHGPDDPRRRDAGRSAHRKGQVDDLVLEPGSVTATVRHPPTRAGLSVTTLDDGAFARVVEALSTEVGRLARLRRNEPLDLEAIRDETGVTIWPGPGDIRAECACGRATRPCVHVAALHAALAARLDEEPHELLRLRGRSAQRLLDDVRRARGELDAPAAAAADLRDPFRARGDLAAILPHPHPPQDPASLLDRLGPPPGVDDVDGFVRLVTTAAGTAWRLASGEGADTADDELLLAELRAQRVAGAPALAAALGRDEADVRSALERLHADGAVLKTGAGDRARYRAGTSPG